MKRSLQTIALCSALLAAGWAFAQTGSGKETGKAAGASTPQPSPSTTSPPTSPAPPAATSPSVTITDTLTAYLLPDDLKLKLRTLQLEWAEREAANQTMQVTIEKNRARQAEITEEIRRPIAEYAQSKGIDLKVWEPDPKELKFVKRKPAAAAAK